MKNKMSSVALVGAVALASCGGGSDAEPFDSDRACRVGQRLVDETASGDRDGVIRQIERLDDLDGIDESGLEVDDLDSIAEALDEQSVEDLIAEFDVVDCDLESADVESDDVESDDVESDDVESDETTAPVATNEPPATQPAPANEAEPVETPAPETTTDSEATPDPAPSAGGTGVPVEVGSTGPGAEIGINRPTEDILAAYGIAGYLFSPNTNVIELRISRTDASFSDDISWSNSESITMSAATDLTLDDVRAAYRAALEALDVDFDFSESTTTDDGRESVGVEASPTDFGEGATWDIRIAQDTDTPGIVLIEVDRRETIDGVVPGIVEPARPLLQATADIGSNLGWTVTGFGHTLSVNSFDDSLNESGRVEWAISDENTVRESATALQDAVGVPIDNEDVDDERISWFLDDGSFSLFAVNYFEFGGTTATYSP